MVIAYVEGARRIVGALAESGALAPAVDPEEALATLAAISDVRFALLLRDDYGWTPDRVERWIAVTSRTLLLRDA